MPGMTATGLPYPLPTDSARNPAAAIEALAEALDTNLKGIVDSLPAAQNLVCGMATNPAQQVIQRAGPVALKLSAELLDTANMVNLDTQPLGFTIPSDGVYLCYGFTQWQTNTTGTRTTALLKNTAQFAQAIQTPPDIVGWATEVTSLTRLLTGDLISLGANHTAGGLGITGLTVPFCSLLVYRISS